MPRIREYQSTVAAPQPSGVNASTAASLGEAKASGIQGFNQPIAAGLKQFGAAMTKYEEEEETTKLFADFTTKEAELHSRWNDIAKTPEALADPEGTAQHFLEDQVGPELTQLGDGLGTRAAKLAFAKMRASSQADFYKNVTADQATLVGVNSQKNFIQTLNAGTSMVLRDPTLAASASARWSDYVDSIPGIDPKTRAKYLEEGQKGIAVARVNGIANSGDYVGARAAVTNPYLDAQDQETLLTHITSLERQGETDKRLADADKRRQEEEKYGIQTEKFIQDWSIERADGTLGFKPGAATAAQQQLFGDPNDGRFRAILNMIDNNAAGKDGVRENAIVKADLYRRVYLPPGDPQRLTQEEIYAANGRGDINSTTRNDLRQEAEGSRDPDYRLQRQAFTDRLAGLRQYITLATPFNIQADPTGYQRWGEFQAISRQTLADTLRAGGSSDDAYQKILQILPRYQNPKTLDQQINQTTEALGGAAPKPLAPVGRPGIPFAPGPQRNPGESITEFKKRLGVQ